MRNSRIMRIKNRMRTRRRRRIRWRMRIGKRMRFRMRRIRRRGRIGKWRRRKKREKENISDQRKLLKIADLEIPLTDHFQKHLFWGRSFSASSNVFGDILIHKNNIFLIAFLLFFHIYISIFSFFYYYGFPVIRVVSCYFDFSFVFRVCDFCFLLDSFCPSLFFRFCYSYLSHSFFVFVIFGVCRLQLHKSSSCVYCNCRFVDMLQCIISPGW